MKKTNIKKNKNIKTAVIKNKTNMNKYSLGFGLCIGFWPFTGGVESAQRGYPGCERSQQLCDECYESGVGAPLDNARRASSSCICYSWGGFFNL